MKLKSKSAKSKPQDGKGLKIAIVFSGFNDVIGQHLLDSTIETLIKSEISKKDIEIVQVPGSLEIPFAAQQCSKSKKYDAIITLGVVIRGDTPHFDLVANESYRGIMDINLTGAVPVIFGIITANNKKQAIDRALKNKMNKGAEFAEAAIEMAHLVKAFKNRKQLLQYPL